MNCRNARALMGDDASLTPDQRQALHRHLAECAACRDELDDPVGRLLRLTMPAPATPPADLTARVLRRLPEASPLELWEAQRAQQHRRARRRALLIGLALVALLGLSLVLRGWWTGTLLAALAAAITQVAATALAPLTVMLGSAIAVGWLLRLLLARATPPLAFGAAALALLLLGVSLATVAINDRVALARSSPDAPPTTIAAPIELDASSQGAVSLLGDILVRGPVRGPVVTLAGRVRVLDSASVDGAVLAGAGVTIAPGGQVTGQIAQATGGPALSAALRGDETATVSPLLVRALALLLGAALALALAALLILLWPHRSLETSRIVSERPGLALAAGLMLTVLLALLALPVLALLALTVAGLALVPLLLLALHVVYVQGLAAVGQALGQRLTGAPTLGSALWGVAAQLALVLALSLISPLLGLLAFYLIASLGLGAHLLRRGAAHRPVPAFGRA